MPAEQFTATDRTKILPGVPVFPVERHGKRPLTPHGFKDATKDERTITAWWTRWPDANIAMPTGAETYDVLDVDVRAEGDGWAAFNRLNGAGLLAGALGVVRTPSTGIHVYFPGTGQLSGSLPKHHLDMKASGGYVLLPPSYVITEHYRGSYVLESDLRAEATGEPLDWPACVALLTPPASHPSRIERGHSGTLNGLGDWLRRQPEGNRNRALYWAARRALESGCDDPGFLFEAARDVGLPEREIRRTLASAYRAGVRHD